MSPLLLDNRHHTQVVQCKRRGREFDALVGFVSNQAVMQFGAQFFDVHAALPLDLFFFRSNAAVPTQQLAGHHVMLANAIVRMEIHTGFRQYQTETHVFFELA